MSINEIYPNCCMLNKESKNNLHVNILDLDLLTFDNIMRIKLFNKREYLNFNIQSLPGWFSNISKKKLSIDSIKYIIIKSF